MRVVGAESVAGWSIDCFVQIFFCVEWLRIRPGFNATGVQDDEASRFYYWQLDGHGSDAFACAITKRLGVEFGVSGSARICVCCRTRMEPTSAPDAAAVGFVVAFNESLWSFDMLNFF